MNVKAVMAFNLALGITGVISCSGSEYSDLVTKCKQVELGMTEGQVLKELGPPSRGRERLEIGGRQVVSLMYKAPSLQAIPPYILIDATSGSVIRIVCADDYEIVERTK